MSLVQPLILTSLVLYSIVSLASTSLTWSERTVPQLRPLQLLAHTYMYTMDFITMHAATYYFGLLGGHTYFQVINDPLQ